MFRLERVERLETALLASLREAAHIRALEPDEAVAIVVVGSCGMQGVSAVAVTSMVRNPGAAPDTEDNPTYVLNTLVPESQDAGVLTLHVLKADIDALAAGQLTDEEFQKRATIVIR